MYIVFLPAIIISYLLGSIPFGLIIARAHGKDLRKIGSGNIGATNVSRALGRKWAYVCFALDVLKGFIPAITIFFIANPSNAQSHFEKVIMLWLWLITGCATILGHVFPIFLKFKGGKGVSTSFGVALGIWPYYTFCALIAIIFWVVVVSIWRYVSLASIVASVVFPISLIVLIFTVQSWDFIDLWPLLITSSAIPLMVILRHRENIKRLLAGTETKIKDRKNQTSNSQQSETNLQEPGH
jgi:glycerol-3-phosphate acyltransferase PlsY